MIFNVHNRLGKKVTAVNLPNCKGYAFQREASILLDETVSGWRINDWLIIGGVKAVVVDSASDANPPVFFIEYVD
jgi:hypothetical protein